MESHSLMFSSSFAARGLQVSFAFAHPGMPGSGLLRGALPEAGEDPGVESVGRQGSCGSVMTHHLTYPVTV